MEGLEIVEELDNNLEDLKEHLKLTTERCLYASKQV